MNWLCFCVANIISKNRTSSSQMRILGRFLKKGAHMLQCLCGERSEATTTTSSGETHNSLSLCRALTLSLSLTLSHTHTDSILALGYMLYRMSVCTPWTRSCSFLFMHGAHSSPSPAVLHGVVLGAQVFFLHGLALMLSFYHRSPLVHMSKVTVLTKKKQPQTKPKQNTNY